MKGAKIMEESTKKPITQAERDEMLRQLNAELNSATINWQLKQLELKKDYTRKREKYLVTNKMKISTLQEEKIRNLHTAEIETDIIKEAAIRKTARLIQVQIEDLHTDRQVTLDKLRFQHEEDFSNERVLYLKAVADIEERKFAIMQRPLVVLRKPILSGKIGETLEVSVEPIKPVKEP